MEQLATTKPVVVTGAGSFIGSHIVEQLLGKGYTVRGTVRKINDSKNKHLLTFQQQYGKEKLQKLIYYILVLLIILSRMLM